MPQTIADQFASVPMSPSLGRALGKAEDAAREQSHRALLLEHLLLALTEDPDATTVLKACNVDVLRLGTDVSNYLGQLPEDMRSESAVQPAPDPELMRVLEAARQAGEQSRRKQIDGSIVLAAIVGDGKSPAAGLLKTHGMTFEEAIRALQKASAQARSKQFGAPSGAAPSERPAAAAASEKAAPAAPAPAPAAVEQGVAAQPQGSGQSVDEILASARARIQQRSAAAPAKADAKSPAPKPAQDAAETLPLMSLSSFQAAPVPAPPDMPPPLESQHHGPPDGSPPGPPGPASLPLQARLSQMPQEAPPPQPTGQAGPSPPPPLPPRPAADGAAQPRIAGWPARPQRPDADAPPPPRRSLPASGRAPPQRRPQGEAMPRPAARPGPPARSGQRPAAGPLVETIPRRMRLGAPTPAQVRIGREKVDGLVQLLLAGRAPQRPDAIAHALTVRLRAPDGGFWIEPASPETQWVDAAPGNPQDEPISWRWTVTPQRRGRRRLQLLVAARTISRDGIAAEAAPPDRVIDVAVRGNPGRRIVRLTILLVLIGVGAAVGKFGQEAWDTGLAATVNRLVSNVLGLLVSSGFLGG